MQAMVGGAPSSSSFVHLVVAAVGQQWRAALLLLVLDEEEDVAQRQAQLTLAARQQVVVSVQARGEGVAQCWVQQVRGEDKRVRGEAVLEQAAVMMLSLACDFSLGQVLWVPLLASGHRPGIYTGIARRAAREGSALLLVVNTGGR